MNIIVHLPTNEMQINELKKAVANLHSEKIISLLQKSYLQNYDVEKVIVSITKNN